MLISTYWWTIKRIKWWFWNYYKKNDTGLKFLVFGLVKKYTIIMCFTTTESKLKLVPYFSELVWFCIIQMSQRDRATKDKATRDKNPVSAVKTPWKHIDSIFFSCAKNTASTCAFFVVEVVFCKDIGKIQY